MGYNFGMFEAIKIKQHFYTKNVFIPNICRINIFEILFILSYGAFLRTLDHFRKCEVYTMSAVCTVLEIFIGLINSA